MNLFKPTVGELSLALNCDGGFVDLDWSFTYLWTSIIYNINELCHVADLVYIENPPSVFSGCYLLIFSHVSVDIGKVNRVKTILTISNLLSILSCSF